MNESSVFHFAVSEELNFSSQIHVSGFVVKLQDLGMLYNRYCAPQKGGSS